MFKKTINKHVLFIGFLTIFLFLGNTVLALEVEGIGLTNDSSIGELVAYLFKIIISIGITLATVSFAIGAIGLISPDPEGHNGAKDRMKGAILGILLMTTSLVIINQINPKIANTELTALPATTGVFLTTGETGEKMPCPQSVSDSSTLGEFGMIEYICAHDDDPKLMIWKFPNKNYSLGQGEDWTQADTETIACGETTSVSPSFRWDYEYSGVYFYMDASCSKYASGVSRYSADNIMPDSKISAKFKSVKIVNGSDKYGIILHKITDLKSGGECGEPIIKEGCSPIKAGVAGAADIFKINTTDSSGDGVGFYSKPYGWASGTKGGYAVILDTDIEEAQPIFKKSTTDKLFEFQYSGMDVTEAYKKKCTYFKKCPGSILIEGNYLVGLYSNNNSYCQTFTRSVSNLEVLPVVNYGRSIDSVYIIPTQ